MPHTVPSASAPVPDHDRPTRSTGLNAAQVAGIVTFPLLGAALAVAGMPVDDVLLLLAGCGAIGAFTIAAAGGGRRLLAALGAALGAAVGPGKQ